VRHNPALTGSSENHWKELYTGALFETDMSKIGRRIAEAQLAIVARRRKSLMSGISAKERQALDTALLSLQALANCLATSPRLAAEVRAASGQAANPAA
jgi:hypothetical protein